MNSFSSRLIDWQRQHGRHDLPWQGENAYRIWLSEVMLQQTQVSTVIPYYLRFIDSFPTVTALATASQEQVLTHWSGLGYYARGRNLHRAARLILEKHHGEFPHQFEQIFELPGIGRSTAAAICALAYDECRAILDGNVKRVLARYCGISGFPGEKKVNEQLWQQAEALLPQRDVACYTQALMDMGATICTRTRPKCDQCPVQADCAAHQTQRVNELPTPRSRKAAPEKRAQFLLLLHGNDILLEKRISTGIWGGLWCPPQLDEQPDSIADYMRHHGMIADKPVALPGFTHTFTHFKLHITPVLLRVPQKPVQLQESYNAWLDVEKALQAAIPTPVRKMLKELQNCPQPEVS